MSVDGGKSWVEAELQRHDTQPSQNWAWTLWKVNVPVDKKEKNIEIVARVNANKLTSEFLNPMFHLFYVGNRFQQQCSARKVRQYLEYKRPFSKCVS